MKRISILVVILLTSSIIGFAQWTTTTPLQPANVFTGGNVGIGSATPIAVLDVRTKLPSQANYASQIWTTDNSSCNLKLQTTWDANGITQQFVQKFNGVDYTSLSFYNGNVGIGSMIPDAKLAVKGTIHAQEVKVDLSVPGPDYVFEETYNLPSLTDTETYIKQNKHLPEVPSACEMEEKGINLSEMNMILLKKVEELTLYIINQQKQIDSLKEGLKK